MTTTIGIDPDSKDLAIAFWGERGPMDARVIHVTGRATDYEMVRQLTQERALEFTGSRPEVIAIEGQQIDGRRTRAGATDLFKLAHVTGAVMLWITEQLPAARTLVPPPKLWKGQLKKEVHQARLYTDLGWGYQLAKGYAVPQEIPQHLLHITRGQWKHVGDAFLLARWAHQQVR